MRLVIDSRELEDEGVVVERVVLRAAERELKELGKLIFDDAKRVEAEKDIAEGERVLAAAKEIRWIVRRYYTPGRST